MQSKMVNINTNFCKWKNCCASRFRRQTTGLLSTVLEKPDIAVSPSDTSISMAEGAGMIQEQQEYVQH
jgi:hypothetical protein